MNAPRHTEIGQMQDKRNQKVAQSTSTSTPEWSAQPSSIAAKTLEMWGIREGRAAIHASRRRFQ